MTPRPPAIPVADSAAPLAVVDGTVTYVPVGSIDPGQGIDHIAVAGDAGGPGQNPIVLAALDDTTSSHSQHGDSHAAPPDTTPDSGGGSARGADDSHALDTLLGPSSVDGIAVKTLGGFDHNRSSVFGDAVSGWPPDTDSNAHSAAAPADIAFNHPHLLPDFDIAGGHGAANPIAEIAYDQAWLNDMEANLANGFASGAQDVQSNGDMVGVASPDTAAVVVEVADQLLPGRLGFDEGPAGAMMAVESSGLSDADFSELGVEVTAGFVVGSVSIGTGYPGPTVLGNATIIGSFGSSSETTTLVGTEGTVLAVVTASTPLVSFTGNGDDTVLFSGNYADTLIGATGATEQNTFVLDAGETNGTVPLVHIQNFTATNDVIDIAANLYPSLGATAATSGPNQNVFTLANDAAATSYTGANAAILVVGSGSNADVYYYNPHDANFGNQAHAYQIAEVDNASATNAASKVTFVHLPSTV